MTTSRFSRGEALISVAGVTVFVCTFLPWFKAEIDDALKAQVLATNPFAQTAQTFNGWDAGTIWGLVGILALVSAGLILLPHLISGLTIPPAHLSTAAAVAALVAGVMVLFKLAIGASINITGVSTVARALAERFIDVKRQWGLILASVGGAALVLGSVLRFQELQAAQRSPEPPDTVLPN